MNASKKQSLMPAIVLGVICLAVALLISVLNMFTAPTIDGAKKEAISESLRVVMPNGLFGESLPLDGAPETVTGIYKDENGGGHVVTLSTTKGYTGKPIALTVGVDTEGKITGAVITATEETKDTDKVAAFAADFKGMGAADIDGAALVSGATYSSRAVKNALNDALVALGYAEPKAEEEIQKPSMGGVSRLTEEEAYANAMALLPQTASPKKIPLKGLPDTAKAVYLDEKSGSYVLHIATRSEWAPLKAEGFVLVDKKGTIQKMTMTTWDVKYSVEDEETPRVIECTPEFTNSFVGKTAHSIQHVDLVSGATGTSGDFAAAVGDTMAVLFPVPVYRYLGIGVAAFAVLLTAVFIILRKRRGF